MKIERYNEWAVNEGLFDSFKNAMSRVVGGAVSKLDSLIKKYKANEDNYWSHYISAQNMLTKAKTLQYGVSNQLEHSKYTEEKNRIQKLIDTIEKSKSDISDSLIKQANLIIAGNERLKDYWTMQKAKMDGKIAQDVYSDAKKLSDENLINSIFLDVEKKIADSKKKELDFKKKYGGTTSWDTVVSTTASPSTVATPTPGTIPPDTKNTEIVKEEPKEETPAIKEPDLEKIKKWMSDVCEELPEKGRENLVTDLVNIYYELVKRGVDFNEAKFMMSQDVLDIYDDKNKQNILSRVLSVSEINDIIKKSYGK